MPWPDSWDVRGSGARTRNAEAGLSATERCPDRSLTRDALGRATRDDVLEGWSRGPNAREWERDSLGSLRFARSLEDSEVLNEVEYRYDAWGGVAEFRESHDGPVTPQNDPEKAPRVFQEFEGPTMVTSPSMRRFATLVTTR